MRKSLHTSLLLAAALSSGCFDEGLNIVDLVGTVVVPKEAASREISRPVLKDDGTPEVDVNGDPVFATEMVEDPRLIGPVYLGLYPAVSVEAEAYPSPSGQFALPYGGTTIGDFRVACVESLQCKLISGRYVDWQGIVDWYKDTIGQPIVDDKGNDVTSGAYLQQVCNELYAYTEDVESGITVSADRNDDGKLDAKDLDFVKNADGDYEAPFTIWQQEFFTGFQLWGFMDAPSAENFKFTTCDPENGFQVTEYSQDFRSGTQHKDILTRPTFYIQDDDWVTSEAQVWDDAERPLTLVIDQLAKPGSVIPSGAGGNSP